MLNYVGVIGDIHGEDTRLESALEFLRQQKVEAILAIGDIADGPGDFQRCVDLLREYDVQSVRGNHDDWFLRNLARDLENAHDDNALDVEGRAWLGALPLKRQWHTASGELLLCHGVGDNFMRDLRPDDDKYTLQYNRELNELVHEDRFRWMINGHTHQRMVRRFGNLVNLKRWQNCRQRKQWRGRRVAGRFLAPQRVALSLRWRNLEKARAEIYLAGMKFAASTCSIYFTLLLPTNLAQISFVPHFRCFSANPQIARATRRTERRR